MPPIGALIFCAVDQFSSNLLDFNCMFYTYLLYVCFMEQHYQ